MSERQTKIAIYNSLHPLDYTFLEHLALDQCHRPYELSLYITLLNRRESGGKRLALSFSKVRNLRLNPEQSELSFSLLSIVPFNDGWEDVNFKVFNDEQDVEFSFYCSDFTAKVIECSDEVE